MALALLMLGAAWFRKRLLLGIAMALYGLSIFNLHYWGFGFPFILAGAWYLVRAYRLSEKLKHAKAEQPGAAGRGSAGPQAPAVQALHPAGRAGPADAQAQAGQGARGRLSRPPGRPARAPARACLVPSAPWAKRLADVLPTRPSGQPLPGSLHQFTRW